MADFGYDISDYMAIDPIFGTMDDFVSLVASAHSKGFAISNYERISISLYQNEIFYLISVFECIIHCLSTSIDRNKIDNGFCAKPFK